MYEEGDIKSTVINYLESKGYKVWKTGEYPLTIGSYRRFPDIFAKKAEKSIVIECKGGSSARFYSVIDALGQVLAIKAHYPEFDVVIAVPSTWGEDCLSRRIRKTYSVKLWLVNPELRLVFEV